MHQFVKQMTLSVDHFSRVQNENYSVRQTDTLIANCVKFLPANFRFEKFLLTVQFLRAKKRFSPPVKVILQRIICVKLFERY